MRSAVESGGLLMASEGGHNLNRRANNQLWVQINKDFSNWAQC